MRGEVSWTSHCFHTERKDIGEFICFLEASGENAEDEGAVSMDVMLPDDLLERVLACLPIASIFRAGSVCKRWHEIICSKSFLWNFPHFLPRKPWYFMFMSSDVPNGYAYDPILRKWHGIELPCIEMPNWFVASSHGLVCFMDNDTRSELHVCNPITKTSRKLEEPPGPRHSDYNALAISVDKGSHRYTVSVVKSKQIPGNFYQWEISMHIYDSGTTNWTAVSSAEVLTGWRGGDESVICDGVLYFLVYSTGTGGGVGKQRHGLIAHDLSDRASASPLMGSFVAGPDTLTCGRLMNLKEKLVMVGGIGKQDRADIIKGIGIWVLDGKHWQEVARMPHRFFQGFGEIDDVFASSGSDELIYIHSYGSEALLAFDMNQRQWKWSNKCPVSKKFPLQLFTGFCFEPRLEVSP